MYDVPTFINCILILDKYFLNLIVFYDVLYNYFFYI